ncbi:MAG: sterol desaturase family protein [Wenzhouxiangellaceae bacterium]|nr:sterol desaturase family protein [Wenzhouxiangellaceae bacterium]
MELLTQIPLPSLIATSLGLSAVIALRYLAISGLFYWLLWGRAQHKVRAIKLMRGQPHAGAVRSEINWSLLSSFIYAAPAAIVFEMWRLGGTAVYVELDQYPLWYIPLSIFIYLFLHDTYFYWTHRLMHRPALFPVMHKVHHQSRPPTPFAAFSFHPYESVISAIFPPLMALFIPIHVGAILFILTLMTMAAVFNHSGYEIFPKWWLRSWPGRHLITAAHHDLHHRYLRTNYGLYFRFWDKLMGTDRMEQEYEFLRKEPPPAIPVPEPD